ncbi:unnamed protein product [Trichobilharzia regenti]|nr:unnamed protein product [Trichobilharzia regenti]
MPNRMAMSILTPTTSTQVSVSNKMIGAIMGRSGCRINQVRHESNADIKISKQEPGVEDRIITITGTPEQIQNAQFLLQMCLSLCCILFIIHHINLQSSDFTDDYLLFLDDSYSCVTHCSLAIAFNLFFSMHILYFIY